MSCLGAVQEVVQTDQMSAETPQEIEYYTPHDGIGLTPGSEDSTRGWTPLNKTPISIDILKSSKNDETFSSQIMKYDQEPEPVAIAEVNSECFETEGPDEEPMMHKFHQGGVLAVIGRGRFSKRRKATQLLWQASNMARDMQSRMHDPQTLQTPPVPNYQPVDSQAPQFWICSRSDEFLKRNVQRIIRFVQHNTVFKNLLGLTRPDGAHWVNDWLQMSSSEGPLVESVANHIFGNTLLSYPETSVLNILIKFYVTSPTKRPILLRISIGQDHRSDILDCPNCSKIFQLIDYIGPQGAAKLQISSRADPRNHASQPHKFRSWEDFSNEHITKRFTVHTKWSQIAYLYQGWLRSSLLVRCTCDAKIHKNQDSEHFINLWDEKMCEEDRVVFDPTGEIQGDERESFAPFPQESSRVLIANIHKTVGDTEEEDIWDPNGDAGSEDEFDPTPPEEHIENHLSPAVRLDLKPISVYSSRGNS